MLVKSILFSHFRSFFLLRLPSIMDSVLQHPTVKYIEIYRYMKLVIITSLEDCHVENISHASPIVMHREIRCKMSNRLCREMTLLSCLVRYYITSMRSVILSTMMSNAIYRWSMNHIRFTYTPVVIY